MQRCACGCASARRLREPQYSGSEPHVSKESANKAKHQASFLVFVAAVPRGDVALGTAVAKSRKDVPGAWPLGVG